MLGWLGNIVRSRRDVLVCSALLLSALAAYSNHFRNSFHFDDMHTIVDNVFIETPRHIPRFFVDATLFSSSRELRVWRPLVSTSLAIDYWLGHGRNPFYFHLSTFSWFCVQLILMFFLYRRLMEQSLEDASANLWAAALAAGLYAVHPANAETVNYIIQRGDLYNALGVTASILWFAAYPKQRKHGWYLLPALAAFLSKAPALIYPFILLSYLYLFEHWRDWRAAVRAAAPAFAVTGGVAVVTALMTPSTFRSGSPFPWLYRATQPWIALHYFKSFFLPTDLSADSDWTVADSALSGEAIIGYLFVIGVVAAIIYTSRRRDTRPIAFGLSWFALAFLPTALTPLSDVTTDHRMFFPFVGLTLAVFWSARLAILHLAPGRTWIRAGAVVTLGLLIAAGLGTRQRNRVWRDEESLWRDVTLKSPGNARGWMNYGAIFLQRQDFAEALGPLERAERLFPNYAPVHVNLANAYGSLGRENEAIQHYQRALALVPDMDEPHLHYGLWLKSKGRLAEAEDQLREAVRINSLSFKARDLLTQIYTEEGKQQQADQLLEETVRLAFDEQTARRYMAERARRAEDAKAATSTPEGLVNLAAQYCRDGHFAECLAASKKAVELRPNFAEAYNNTAVAYLSLHRWDEGIEAARKALLLKPDHAGARANLQWALEHQPNTQTASR